MNLEFTEKILKEDVKIWGINDFIGIDISYCLDTENEECLINFNADFDVKNYGIRGVGISFSSINCEFDVTINLDDIEKEDVNLFFEKGFIKTISGSLDILSKHIILEYKNNNEMFVLSNEMPLNNCEILINEVEFDFKIDKNSWYVEVS